MTGPPLCQGRFTPDREGFGISEAAVHNWESADVADGLAIAAPASGESGELRGEHKRIRLLEQEAEVMRRAVAYLSRDVNRPTTRPKEQTPMEPTTSDEIFEAAEADLIERHQPTDPAAAASNPERVYDDDARDGSWVEEQWNRG